MSGLSPVSGLSQMPLPGVGVTPAALRAPTPAPTQAGQGTGGAGFGELLGKVVDTVQSRQDAAQEATRAVLAGESDKIHQGMIALQESSVAFSLMVEVRNRLVESYQELMRMPV